MTSKSNDDILRRVKKIVEFYEAGTWPERYKDPLDGQSYQHINPESFERNKDMLNFTREFCNILEKYKVKLHSVTGGLYSFSIPNSEGTEDFLGIDNMNKFLLPEEELDRDIEGERKCKEVASSTTYTNYDTEDEDKEDEEDSWCIYTAVAVFTADVDMVLENVNRSDGDFEEYLCDLAWDKFEKDGLDADCEDDDEFFKALSYEKLDDTTYRLKLKNLKFSMGLEIGGCSLDSCNDDRWSVFSDSVDAIPYLIDVRDDYVSEVD